MALENKAQKAKREALEALPRIVSATGEVDPGYTFCTREIVDWLTNQGYVEANEAIVNESGGIATRATQAGIEFASTLVDKNKEQTAPAEITVEEPKPERKVKMTFEIENVAVVAGKRGGGTRTSQYPIDALEVGQSFFIPASEKHPNPEKSLASMLSGAMKKYDVPDLDEATGVQKTKVITVPKTGEKREIPATKHTRKFTLVAAEKDGVAGARIGRTA